MKLTNEAFERWQTWMKAIEPDLQELVEFRAIYEYFEKVVARNIPHLERNNADLWCMFIRLSYGAYAAMAVRRHLDDDKDAISLARLLGQIKSCANQFSYARYLDFFPIDSGYGEWQRGTFDRFSDDGETLSEDRIQADLDELRNICMTIKGVADRQIGHLDKRGVTSFPSGNDLNKGIDLYNALVCKYRVLLTGRSMITLESVKVIEWAQVFRVPLDVMPPDHA